jgi:predicted MFS family arabinose efflux permease
MKVRLILGGILLLCLAMAFNLMFSWSALDEFYTESSLARLGMTGHELKTLLGASLPSKAQITDENSAFLVSLRQRGTEQSGGVDSESLRLIRGVMDHTLAALLSQYNERTAESHSADHAASSIGLTVSIAWPDGRLLCGTDGNIQENERRPSQSDISWLRGKNPNDERPHLTRDGRTTLALSVKDARERTVAYVLMGFPEQFVSADLAVAKRRNLYSAVIISLASCILLAFILRKTVDGDLDLRKSQKKNISITVFLITVAAQLGASGLNIYAFTQFAWNNTKAESEMTCLRLKKSIDQNQEPYVLQSAFRVIDETMACSPQFNQIRLLDRNGRLIHVAPLETSQTPKDGWIEEVKNVGRTFFNPDIQHRSIREVLAGTQLAGFVSVTAKPYFIYEKLLKVIADALTVTIISLLFLVELMVLFFELFITKVSRVKGAPAERPETMRPAAFFFVFGIDISVSFLPLHMKSLYEPLLGLSRDFVLGLPISVEFICVGFAILVAGVWVDRRGWHEPFLVGLSLAGGGVIYSWLAPTSLHFVFSRAIAGAGYGLSLMASQGFVIHYSDRRSKAHGLAQLFAGIYAGSICGSATGAMLAERFGYVTVFGIGAFIILTTLIYTVAFMRGYMVKPPPLPSNPTARRVRRQNSLLAFMLDRTVISLIFFSSLPAAIGVVGFLNYFSPIYLSSIGASQSTIGRILMIYGVSLIYLGPYISRYVDASPDKRIYVFTGCVLGSMTFLAFFLFQGIWAAVLAVLLLGLSSSFVLASQSAYVLQLPVTQDLGEGKAIGIFRSSSRIGQALGPMVFGAVMARGNINDGIAFFGLMYLMTAILFLLMNLRRSKTPVLGEVGGV